MQMVNGRIPGSSEWSQLFIGRVSSVASDFTQAVFNIPPEARMIYILACSGGAGGSAGTTNATTGAGGSSGTITRWYGPTAFLPATLYLRVGSGGKGGSTSGGAGVAGGISNVTISPTASIEHTLVTTTASGGGSGATGGSGGAAATLTNMRMATLGQWFSLGGQAGTNAGANAVTFGATGLIVTGGTGAGSGGSASGALNHPSGSSFTSTAGTANGAGSGFPGRDFVSSKYIGPGLSFFSEGGTGAGDQTGVGGDGGPGSGGGGGSASASNFSNGGNGGPGFIYICCTD